MAEEGDQGGKMSNYRNSNTPLIDHSIQRYPYCIVWTPLPLISWFLPFIGHTGIADSRGVIYDFAGPYTIGVGKLAFSAPTRYVQLDPAFCTTQNWDEGISNGCEVYKHRMHNLFCDNCHSHVAKCLNNMGYGKKSDYGMVGIAVWVFFQGKFVSPGAFLQTYLPFAIIIAIIVIASKFA